jgi:hypothetical protein
MTYGSWMAFGEDMIGSADGDCSRDGDGDRDASGCGCGSSGVFDFDFAFSFLILGCFVVLAFFLDFVTFFSTGSWSSAVMESRLALRFSLFPRCGVWICIVRSRSLYILSRVEVVSVSLSKFGRARSQC